MDEAKIWSKKIRSHTISIKNIKSALPIRNPEPVEERRRATGHKEYGTLGDNEKILGAYSKNSERSEKD